MKMFHTNRQYQVSNNHKLTVYRYRSGEFGWFSEFFTRPLAILPEWYGVDNFTEAWEGLHEP